MTRRKHFYGVVYSEDSQFDYYDGTLACTFCCLESADFLFKNERLYELSKEEMIEAIDKSCEEGAKKYGKNSGDYGIISCDEAFSLHESYKKRFVLGDTLSGRLCDSDSFLQLLQFLEKRDTPVACVLTKPIETILVFYNPLSPYKFIIFDSHGRLFDELYGAAFYFFLDKQSCQDHLREIFKVTYKNKYRKSERELLMPHNLFEGTLIHQLGATKKKKHRRVIILQGSRLPKRKTEETRPKEKTNSPKSSKKSKPKRIEKKPWDSKTKIRIPIASRIMNRFTSPSRSTLVYDPSFRYTGRHALDW